MPTSIHKNIGKLWEESGRKVGLKVRWLDWGDQFKYFKISSYSEDESCVLGTLDNGEKTSYPCDSQQWSLYEENTHPMAKAV